MLMAFEYQFASNEGHQVEISAIVGGTEAHGSLETKRLYWP